MLLSAFLTLTPAFPSSADGDQASWLKSQIASTGVVKSYDNGSEDVSLYANSLAAIAFIHSWNFEAATRIFDVFSDIYFNSTQEGVSQNPGGLLYDQRLASDPIGTGYGDFRTGENAWLMIALNYYEAFTGDTRYSPLADSLVEALLYYRNVTAGNIAYGAFKWGPGNDAYSTEFQLDIYSALRVRGELNDDDVLRQIADELRDYLLDDPGWPLEVDKTKVWLAYTDALFNGELYDGPPTPIYLDAQAWGVLALYPPRVGEPDFTQVLGRIDDGGAWSDIRSQVSCEGETVDGFADEYRPGGVDENWVWLEGSLFVSCAYELTGNDTRASFFLGEASKLVKPDGSLYHSCADDLVEYPIPTFPENFRYGSVASTSWYYFCQNSINPFEKAGKSVPATNEWALALLAFVIAALALFARRIRTA